MGTKKSLAEKVVALMDDGPDGAVLDVFGGMCAVGEGLADRRHVWANDIQLFAAEAAAAVLTSTEQLLTQSETLFLLAGPFERNHKELSKRYTRRLQEEEQSLSTRRLSTISRWRHRNRDRHLSKRARQLRAELSRTPSNFPYRLFILTYADGFFTNAQAAEIDSIIYAIHDCFRRGSLSIEQRRWLLLVLGRVLLRLSNTTGHFAQFLTPNSATLSRFLALSRRSVWAEFLEGVTDVRPAGTHEWRRGNRAYHKESRVLLRGIKSKPVPIAIIYADPPYTEDHYSRYYHVLETLFLYDYPDATGRGRYRPGRFQSPFSIKSSAIEAFDEFTRLARRTGADLILTYPEHGLLSKLRTTPLSFLKKYFRKIDVIETKHHHSTFGASKGRAKEHVTEKVYWAKP